MEPNAARNFPHCQQPVTIVSLPAIQKAALPTMPRRIGRDSAPQNPLPEYSGDRSPVPAG
jgi:hypothetical protein